MFARIAKFLAGAAQSTSARPAILFKYTTVDTALRILESQTLGFPSVKDLNDPFESSIQSTLDFLKDELVHIPPMARKPSINVRMGNQILPMDNPHFDEMLKNDNIWTREADAAKRANDSLRYAQDALSHAINALGVLCLTTDPCNALMWAHYANCHRGVCLAIDTAALVDAAGKFAPTSQWNRDRETLKLGKIDYAKERPAAKQYGSEEYVRRAFFTKYADWSYEREWRILRPLHECQRATNGTPIAKVPRECFRALIMGLRVSEDDRLRIEAAMKSLGMPGHAKVRHLDHSYSLCIDRGSLKGACEDLRPWMGTADG